LPKNGNQEKGYYNHLENFSTRKSGFTLGKNPTAVEKLVKLGHHICFISRYVL